MRRLLPLLFCILPLIALEVPEKATRHFSPNLDGAKDNLQIPLSIRKDGYLAKWKVLISRVENGKNVVIRTYESTSAKEISKLTAGRFFQRLVEKKEKIAVPPFVAWNGFVEKAQGSNAVLVPAPHGLYQVQIVAIDESENESRTPWITVSLDLIKPWVGLQAEGVIFSPNGDGRKETLSFNLPKSNVEPLDTVRLEIRSATNPLPQVWQWDGSKLPAVWSWNGNDPAGKPFAEGSYRVRVVAFDLAANSNLSPEWPVELVRTMETLTVAVSAPVFSPNGDGVLDQVSLALKASSRRGMESWVLSVRPAGTGNAVRTWRGTRDLAELVTFDGKDDQGKILTDGLYEIALAAGYDSGNAPEASVVRVEIDNTAPTVAAKALAANFIPVATREGRKELSLEFSGSGREGDRFRLEILDDAKAVVWSSNLPGAPQNFAWDGHNQNGEVVPGKYTAVVQGRDAVGNVARAETAVFDLIGEESKATTAPDVTSFSPGKGVGRDRVNLKTDITQKNLVTSESLVVFNDKKEVVRRMTTNTFIPVWTFDGFGEGGKTLPDGRYSYQVEYELNTGEKPVAMGRPLVLDTTAISLKAPRHPVVFSPNEDGRLDLLDVKLDWESSIQNPEQDRLTLTVRDQKGKVHLQKAFSHPFPDHFVWDGKDQTGAPAPEGDYVIHLEAVDSAQNRSTFAGSPFTLVRAADTATVALSRSILSPALKEKIEIIPGVGSQPRFLTNVSAFALDGKGGKIPLATRKDPGAFVFTGKDIDGKPLKDGRYPIQIVAQFASGNVAVSETREVTVSGRAPEVRLVTQPEYFSPDNDGVDDHLRVGVKITHPLGVARSEMVLYRHIRLTNEKGRTVADFLDGYRAAGQKPFKVWPLPDGEIDAQWQWDGIGDNGDKVESANDYVLFLRSTDLAGNVTNVARPIPVDVLVEKLADGRLKIILNSITFGFDSSRLEGEDGLRVLDRLVYILGKFPEYRISIVGHTDSRGAPKHNLDLSTARAKSVLNYLVDRDVAASRLSANGKGAEELQISPEENPDAFLQEENYRKNRRVEFFLEKKRENPGK